jgi:transcriptional regulator with XRE-family HTH domain
MALGHHFFHLPLDNGWRIAYDSCMTHGREQLADWIERRGVNQREAASLLSMDHTFLNGILTGRRSPGLATAVSIERCTGIPVEAWMPTADGKNAERVVALAGKRK